MKLHDCSSIKSTRKTLSLLCVGARRVRRRFALRGACVARTHGAALVRPLRRLAFAGCARGRGCRVAWSRRRGRCWLLHAIVVGQRAVVTARTVARRVVDRKTRVRAFRGPFYDVCREGPPHGPTPARPPTPASRLLQRPVPRWVQPRGAQRLGRALLLQIPASLYILKVRMTILLHRLPRSTVTPPPSQGSSRHGSLASLRKLSKL